MCRWFKHPEKRMTPWTYLPQMMWDWTASPLPLQQICPWWRIHALYPRSLAAGQKLLVELRAQGSLPAKRIFSPTVTCSHSEQEVTLRGRTICQEKFMVFSYPWRNNVYPAPLRCEFLEDGKMQLSPTTWNNYSCPKFFLSTSRGITKSL